MTTPPDITRDSLPPPSFAPLATPSTRQSRSFIEITRAALIRGVAIGLFSIPVAVWESHETRDRLAQIASDPSTFLAKERAFSHPGLPYNFVIIAILLALIVLVVDGISAVLRSILPSSKPPAAALPACGGVIGAPPVAPPRVPPT